METTPQLLWIYLDRSKDPLDSHLRGNDGKPNYTVDALNFSFGISTPLLPSLQ